MAIRSDGRRAAEMYSGRAIDAGAVGGGGPFPTRLAVPSLHFSLAGVRRALVAIHVSPLADASKESGGNSGGGIDIASNHLPMTSGPVRLQHEAACDIQSVVLAHGAPTMACASGYGRNVLVGCVDALGRATLHRVQSPDRSQAGLLQGASAEGVPPPAKRSKSDDLENGAGESQDGAIAAGLVLNGSCSNADGSTCARPSEWGWAGLGFSRGDQAATVAVVHQLSRSLTLCDTSTGVCISRCFTAQPPRAVAWLSPQLLCLAETTSLTIWDRRVRHVGDRGSAAGANRPDVASTFHRPWEIKWRQQPSYRGILNAITPVNMNDDEGGGGCDLSAPLAAAGDDRMIYVFDARKTLRVIKRWRCPCKYAVTSLHESTVMPGLLYMSGLDNEFLTCCIAAPPAKRRPAAGKPNAAAGPGEPAAETELRPAAEAEGPSENATEQEAEDAPVGGHGRLHQTHRLGVRGDSRWVGVSVMRAGSVQGGGRDSADGEALVGLCSSGSLCILKNPRYAQHAV